MAHTVYHLREHRNSANEVVAARSRERVSGRRIGRGVRGTMPASSAFDERARRSPSAGTRSPGVGQYDKITGVAYAEVDPADPRNAVIVDLGLAEPQAGPGHAGQDARRQGRVSAQFLHPKAGESGRCRPDAQRLREGDVRAAQPRRQDVDARWAASAAAATIPATITDPTILANSFLMPRGYTLVWSGWEPLVPLANLGTEPAGVGGNARSRDKPDGTHDQRARRTNTVAGSLCA